MALDLRIELAVTGTTTLAFVAIDGCLKFRRVAQVLFLALVRIQVLHVPGEQSKGGEINIQLLCQGEE